MPNGSALRSGDAPAVPLIEVHLTGDVPLPGKVAVLPGSRVDDVLFGRLTDLAEAGFPASGVSTLPVANPRTGVVLRTSQTGPDVPEPSEEEFDLRNIRLVRADGSEVPTDLMAYRLGGDLSMNPPVLDGDVVHVRRRHAGQRTVSVSGAVRSQQTLPWKDGDTVEGLLRLAGGVSNLAMPDTVVIVRAESGSGQDGGVPKWTGYSLLKTPPSAIALSPNDRVVVPVDQRRRTAHTVSVEGEVMRPGIYPISDGVTTLADLMEAAGGPTPQARMHDVRVERTKSDPVDGDLLRSSDQPLESLEALREEILMDQRLLYADLRDGAGSPDGVTVLFDGDEIRVEKDERTVRLMGQVSRPGFYGIREGALAEDYIARAGGLGPAADSSRVFVIKSGGRGWVPRKQAVIESGDIVFVDRVPFTESTARQTLDLSLEALELDREIADSTQSTARQTLELNREALELDREIAESTRKRTNVQVFLTVINSTVAVITTYILIRNRY